MGRLMNSRGFMIVIAVLGSNLIAFYLGLRSSGVQLQVWTSEPALRSGGAAVGSVVSHLGGRTEKGIVSRILGGARAGVGSRAAAAAEKKRGTGAAAAQKKWGWPASDELREYVGEKELPLGRIGGLAIPKTVSPVGHACALVPDHLAKYMDYEAGRACPDDQRLAHELMLRGCEPLPRRRCFARVPPAFQEPAPLPESLWSMPPDSNVLWTPYTCKSFACLVERKSKRAYDDCIDCFDLRGRESVRWTQRSSNRDDDLDFSVAEVVELKRNRRRGSIRIGLDLGGGTATFAARMLEHNVTVVTTSLDLNAPFNSFVALRGLVPLHLTLAHRLPFFDNTLDLVHSMHALSNWIPTTSLDFLLFDIDRVLRPGGLLWLDHFFCLHHQLNDTYIPLFRKLRYKKLRWAIGPKLDRRPVLHEVYLSALLEKPLSRKWT